MHQHMHQLLDGDSDVKTKILQYPLDYIIKFSLGVELTEFYQLLSFYENR